MNVTEVPAQTLVELADIETLGVRFAFTVIVPFTTEPAQVVPPEIFCGIAEIVKFVLLETEAAVTNILLDVDVPEKPLGKVQA